MNIEIAWDLWPEMIFWGVLGINALCLLAYGRQIHLWTKRLSQAPKPNQEELIRSDVSNWITVVIPCRNEAENLPSLLSDLAQQTCPIEILVVDDHSSDATLEIAKTAGVKCISNQAHGKKAALRQAHGKVKTPWMATLDADVRIGTDWAKSMMQCIQNNQSGEDKETQAILGTVRIEAKPNSHWQRFQSLEYGCLMAWIEGGVSSGTLAMGSGANSVYRTSTYPANELHENQASGDDAYALLAIKNNNGKIIWNSQRSAFVTTQPVQGWSELWQQRARWASKTIDGSDRETTTTGWIVAAVHFALILAIISGVACSSRGIAGILALFAAKGMMDRRLVSTAVDRYALPLKRLDLIRFPWRYAALVWGSWWHLLRGQVKWKGRKL
jgi:cellulose synthase/poly-beta-1,6-N-acetylglucosamine synthase-like glycosyltransferase